MSKQVRSIQTQQKLIASASNLFRTNGYSATSVEDICEVSGIKKGAFFYHFPTKEALAIECLHAWDESMAGMMKQAIGNQSDPISRLSDVMDLFISTMTHPEMIKSCLAGTTLQEVSESNTALRQAASMCMTHSAEHIQKLIDHACVITHAEVDSHSLGQLWVATLQGSLILYKGSRDVKVIGQSLSLVKHLILNAVKAT